MKWRYEIKYRVPGALADTGLYSVLTHQFVQRSYPARRVNSIYLDTPEMTAATDNLSGVSDRTKHRIRWYGNDAKPTSPHYEIKLRNGRLGSKESYKLDTKSVSNLTASTTSWALSPECTQLKTKLSQCEPMIPVLSVHYDREYFVGPQGLRVTVDQNLHFTDYRYSRSGAKVSPHDPAITIIEVKFPLEIYEPAYELIRAIPFRPMRNSKYVLGLSAINQLVYL